MNIDSMGERTVRAHLGSIVKNHENVKFFLVFLVGVAIVSIYFLVAKSQRTAERLASQRIFLQDEGGMKSVIELGEYGPNIGMMDAQGRQRVSFKVHSKEAQIALQDIQGRDRVFLSGGKSSPVLQVIGEDGKELTGMALADIGPNFGFAVTASKLNLKPLSTDGKTGFQIIDGADKPKVVLQGASAGSTLSFLNDEGKLNTYIEIQPDRVMLGLIDMNGLLRIQCGITENQVEMLIFDSIGRTRAQLGTKEDAGELVFFDDAQVAREAVSLGSGAKLKLLDFDAPVAAENVSLPTEESIDQALTQAITP